MIKDFQKFLIKGNAVDMAVGFMFGAAFATVVRSFVDNLIMPPIGFLLGKIDFSEFAYVLVEATEESSGVTISWGRFLNDLISFFILGFIIFLIVRTITRFQTKEEIKPSSPPVQEVLLTEIRDLLKK